MEVEACDSILLPSMNIWTIRHIDVGPEKYLLMYLSLVQKATLPATLVHYQEV